MQIYVWIRMWVVGWLVGCVSICLSVFVWMCSCVHVCVFVHVWALTPSFLLSPGFFGTFPSYQIERAKNEAYRSYTTDGGVAEWPQSPGIYTYIRIHMQIRARALHGFGKSVGQFRWWVTCACKIVVSAISVCAFFSFLGGHCVQKHLRFPEIIVPTVYTFVCICVFLYI